MPRPRIIWLFIVVFALGEALAQGESPTAPTESSLYDLPLEDLLNLQVSTASKLAEPIEKSPAVVSIVTDKEIEAFGALTLGDVLDRITSVYLTGTIPLSRGMLSIRGDATAGQNNHVLVLLNGRPIRDSIYSGLNEEIYTAFPVQSIKQIEVIRGPGSVLYGTNAFVGVINILTKDATYTTFEPTVRYGSFQGKQIGAFVARHLGELEIAGGISYFHDRGWDFTASDWDDSTKTSTTQAQLQYTRTLGANLLAKYGKWTLNSYYGHEELPFMSNAASIPTWANAGVHRGTRVAADLGFQDQIAEGWKSSVNVTYNRLSVANAVTGSTEEGASNDGLLEWTHYLTFSPKLSGVAGAVYTKQTGSSKEKETGRYSVPSYNNDIYSAYAQLGYEVLEPLRLIAGAQTVKVPGTNLHVVPRAAAIYALNPEVGFKLLYSGAFRAASQDERYLTTYPSGTPTTVGNPSLMPETIGTLDIQAYYQKREVHASVTYFRSRQLNLIFPVIVSGSPRYINIGNQSSQGLEVEAKWIYHSSLELQGSLTFQNSRSDNGTENDSHTPNMMAKVGVSYRYDPSLSVGLFNSYYARPPQVDNGAGLTNTVNPKSDYYNYLSLNVLWDFTKTLELTSWPEARLQLYISNLLNSAVYYPEYVYGVINTFPGRPGRAIFGGLTIKL